MTENDAVDGASGREMIDEKLLRRVFEESNDAIMLIDPAADTIRAVNPAACRMLGYDRGELLTTAPSEIHLDELETFRAFVEEVQRDGRGWTDELTCLTRGGERLPVEISASVVTYEGRDHLLAVVRDVSDRVRQRERIATMVRASHRLARAENLGEIAAITVEIAEGILDQPLTAFWRYDDTKDCLIPVEFTSDVEAMSSGDSTGPVPLPSGTLEMAVFERGEPAVIEDYRSRENTATDAPLGTVLMLPIGEHGVLHMGHRTQVDLGAAERDLAELLATKAEAAFDRAERERQLRERERELQRQNDRLEAFARIVAHDLRNPLNVIAGRADLARETDDEAHFEAIDRAVERMTALIDDTLELARQGAVIEDQSAVALGDVAEDAWASVDTEGAEFVADAPPAVRADRDRLRELLENLFRNAIEHCGGEVTVRLGELTDGTGFYVADDGPGIPAEDREAVFEPGHTTAVDGTGFGLAIVKEIAEAHGWTVEVAEPDLDGGGVSFEFHGVDPAGSPPERAEPD